MTSSNRILKRGELEGDAVSWHAPAMEESFVSPPPSTEPERGVQDPAILRAQAWQEGFEQGRAEGFAAGQADLAQHADILKRVLLGLAKPLHALDHQFEEELLALVVAIARQLVRRELRQDPSHVIGIIREGLAALPSGVRNVQVRLHPEDADVVRELLMPPGEEQAWSIEVDPLLNQGGCMIVSETSQIDERLDTRLTRVVAAMLEDERAPHD